MRFPIDLEQQTGVRFLFQINRKMINTIGFEFDLLRFRKDFSMCRVALKYAVLTLEKGGTEYREPSLFFPRKGHFCNYTQVHISSPPPLPLCTTSLYFEHHLKKYMRLKISNNIWDENVFYIINFEKILRVVLLKLNNQIESCMQKFLLFG